VLLNDWRLITSGVASGTIEFGHID
jgi:hypothetical protein